ncbi:MAG: hypothetical protein GY951_07540 [Psychromonas sp.]|nr:hypothetical protein [Alteromonadales bacterium]MCP5077893.1 hypothetical protein [Psychromonas sp.]
MKLSIYLKLAQLFIKIDAQKTREAQRKSLIFTRLNLATHILKDIGIGQASAHQAHSILTKDAAYQQALQRLINSR